MTDREAELAGRLTLRHGWDFAEAALYFADASSSRADAVAANCVFRASVVRAAAAPSVPLGAP